jgi:hypothetical protein
MSSLGFAYDDPDAMLADLDQAAAELLEQPNADFDELRRTEIQVAVAFQACRGPLEETQKTVRNELELEALQDPRIRSSIEAFGERE